jgi:peptide chain release factor subunit 1
VLDIAYGMEPGFTQAIHLSIESIANLKLVKEKEILFHFFDEIARDTGRYCFTLSDTISALESGCVETLIVSERYLGERWVVCDSASNIEREMYVDVSVSQTLDQTQDSSCKVIDRVLLLEWLADNFNSFGTKLEIVSDSTAEGTQFLQGFGGIGGVLRWKRDESANELEFKTLDLKSGEEESTVDPTGQDAELLGDYFDLDGGFKF